jgi:hypothetical protein
LVCRVGRRDILRHLQIQLSACQSPRQVLNYSTRGTYLVGGGLCHLQLLGDTLLCHIARLLRRRRETRFQASWPVINKGDMGQSMSAEPGP